MAEQASPLGKDSILFASKASKLIDEGNVQHALNLCEAGVRYHPFYAPGHYIMGLCYEVVDNQEDAKNEFERVLMYDPANYKAMRKLSEIYRNSGLKQVADDFLVKEHLYNPLNKQLVAILKDKKLYDRLIPEEQNIEKEIQEIEENIPEQANDEEIPEIAIEEESEDTNDSLPEIDLKEVEEDNSPIGDDMNRFDPLAGNVILDEEELTEEESITEDEKLEGQDLSQYDNTRDDFSTIMDGFFDEQENQDTDEQNIDSDEWIEVENLLIDEDVKLAEEIEKEKKRTKIKDVDPVSEVRDETELLLEELSHSEVISERENEIPNNDLDMEAKSVDSPEAETEDTVNSDLETTENVSQPIDTGEHVPDIPEAIPVATENEIGEEKGDDVSIQDMLENPNLVTPTFGEILIAQRKFSEARHVFLELSKKEPDNPRFIKKIEFLDKFLQAQNPA
jgi:tetratricopeptide (TPR) repeat protein